MSVGYYFKAGSIQIMKWLYFISQMLYSLWNTIQKAMCHNFIDLRFLDISKDKTAQSISKNISKHFKKYLCLFAGG